MTGEKMKIVSLSELLREIRERRENPPKEKLLSLDDAGVKGFKYDPENLKRARRYGFHPSLSAPDES